MQPDPHMSSIFADVAMEEVRLSGSLAFGCNLCSIRSELTFNPLKSISTPI